MRLIPVTDAQKYKKLPGNRPEEKIKRIKN